MNGPAISVTAMRSDVDVSGIRRVGCDGAASRIGLAYNSSRLRMSGLVCGAGGQTGL